ncbi:lysine 5,6-aminomutase subunit alpha TIM-barrel domain-containing protein [Actinokineospora auranticolor]|uniref:lysine 5,6-aminomutase subunit alpha TIM-barrel domain-containing protein n=1 Tax=Actinokineospora auranticolor TaxID=155976 RepID=UPI003CCC3557
MDLDSAVMATARRPAAEAAAPVVGIARAHTILSVERAAQRLVGTTGAGGTHRACDVVWVNRVVDTVAEQCGLEHGVGSPVFEAAGAGPLVLGRWCWAAGAGPLVPRPGSSTPRGRWVGCWAARPPGCCSRSASASRSRRRPASTRGSCRRATPTSSSSRSPPPRAAARGALVRAPPCLWSERPCGWRAFAGVGGTRRGAEWWVGTVGSVAAGLGLEGGAQGLRGGF